MGSRERSGPPSSPGVGARSKWEWEPGGRGVGQEGESGEGRWGEWGPGRSWEVTGARLTPEHPPFLLVPPSTTTHLREDPHLCLTPSPHLQTPLHP